MRIELILSRSQREVQATTLRSPLNIKMLLCQQLNFLDFDYYRNIISISISMEKFKSLQHGQNDTYVKLTIEQFPIIPCLFELSQYLIFFGLPMIEYVALFAHNQPQPIHLDGMRSLRKASLNLSLTEFSNKTYNFYEAEILEISDAYYCDQRNAKKIASFKDSQYWTLLRTDIPHNVEYQDNKFGKTICIRFVNNPDINTLYSLVMSKQLVEGKGFEPLEQVSSLDGLANRCLKPLSHPS